MAPPPRSTPDPQRQLMIKTKTCQRLIKECAYYIQEVKENEEKLQQMIQAGRDPYDIKKFREVLGESEMMVPDSQKRLQQSILDLQTFVQENESLVEGEWAEIARQILDEHTPACRKVSQDNENRVETNVADLVDGEIF